MSTHLCVGVSFDVLRLINSPSTCMGNLSAYSQVDTCSTCIQSVCLAIQLELGKGRAGSHSIQSFTNSLTSSPTH